MKNFIETPICPSCHTPGMTEIFTVKQVPVHSVLLFKEKSESMRYPKGDICLGFCSQCGFISNIAFDPSLHEYSANYEATQAYSSTFNAFQHRLAASLIDRYDLHGKRIIEIGCGQGEFLSLLCELGGNTGVGFDPAYVPERSLAGMPTSVEFIQDFYSEKYGGYQGDLICCKMTLEHIHQTADFIGTVRRSINDRPETIVFFQVPNARYVFGNMAFWDIYYEHCSYFSPGALARLFRRSGFEIENLWTDYDDQYIMIEARPGSGSSSHILPLENDLEILTQEIARFVERVPKKLTAWKKTIQTFKSDGKRTILWGGGSKAVSFLTTLDISTDEVLYVVDINPYKAHTYIAGTGHEIIPPSDLHKNRPDVVIVMNPIYMPEVQRDLEKRGLFPELLSVESITG